MLYPHYITKIEILPAIFKNDFLGVISDQYTNDWVKCSQFVVLTENEEEYYDILGIFPHFCKI